MESTYSVQGILDNLNKQLEISQGLLRILDEEFEALSGNDLPRFETILAAKQNVMDRLETCSLVLLNLASQQDPNKSINLGKFLKQADPEGIWGLAPIWQQLAKLLADCRRKNSINGKIIALNHRHFQKALEILRHGGHNPQVCYGPAGMSQSASSPRFLGKV